jgi:DNA (cytosine-5)-methyltransferase 1
LILIGARKPFSIEPPKQINNGPRLKDILETNPEVETPDYVVSKIKGKYRDLPIIVDPEEPSTVAPTCVAHYAKDLGTRLVKDKTSKHGVRPFSIREYARLQGFSDDFYFENKRSSYKLIGNAVPVQMGEWVGLQAMRYFN